MWQEFRDTFNRVSFWREGLCLEVNLQVHKDAAVFPGFGAYFCSHWCMKEWLRAWVESGYPLDLTFLEFFPILVSILLWGDVLASTTVHS